MERLEYGYHLFSVVYFSRGTLPTKKETVRKGTTGGPRLLAQEAKPSELLPPDTGGTWPAQNPWAKPFFVPPSDVLTSKHKCHQTDTKPFLVLCFLQMFSHPNTTAIEGLTWYMHNAVSLQKLPRASGAHFSLGRKIVRFVAAKSAVCKKRDLPKKSRPMCLSASYI